MDNGSPSKKSALWEARMKLGVKRASLKKRQAKADEMALEVRIWDQKVRALEDQGNN